MEKTPTFGDRPRSTYYRSSRSTLETDDRMSEIDRKLDSHIQTTQASFTALEHTMQANFLTILERIDGKVSNSNDKLEKKIDALSSDLHTFKLSTVGDVSSLQTKSKQAAMLIGGFFSAVISVIVSVLFNKS